MKISEKMKTGNLPEWLTAAPAVHACRAKRLRLSTRALPAFAVFLLLSEFLLLFEYRLIIAKAQAF